jgi:hypothetical protein
MAIGFDPGALISGIAQAQAMAQAAAIQQRQLQFQKENAAKQYRLATAGREDVYGNKQRFDDLGNEWIMQLDPTQQQLVSAGEREQLLSLTEDATRNRALRQRQEQRSLDAGEDYETALAGLRYDQPPEEAAIRGELQRLLGSGREGLAKETQSVLGRQAARLGRGGDIAEIIKNTNDYVGSTTPDRLLQARQGALAESQARQGAHQARHIPRLNRAASTMDAIGNAPQRFSTLPQEMGGQQAQMLQAISQALANESNQVGGAYSNLAQTIAGSAPNLGGVFRFQSDPQTRKGGLTDAQLFDLKKAATSSGNWDVVERLIYQGTEPF